MRFQFLVSERNNLHDDLSLIDPPGISVKYSKYGSDELNDKIIREILLLSISNLALICAALNRNLIRLRCVLGDNFLYVLFLTFMTF